MDIKVNNQGTSRVVKSRDALQFEITNPETKEVIILTPNISYGAIQSYMDIMNKALNKESTPTDVYWEANLFFEKDDVEILSQLPNKMVKMMIMEIYKASGLLDEVANTSKILQEAKKTNK